MKNIFEKPVSDEEAKRLFKKMRSALEDPKKPEEPKKRGPRTGAAAMDEWQREKEAKEDEKQLY